MPSAARGWCGTHYTRWYRHGDPLVVLSSHPNWSDPGCSNEGCEAKHYAKGLCRKHYKQQADQRANEKAYRKTYRQRAEYKEAERKRNARRRANGYQKTWAAANPDLIREYDRKAERKARQRAWAKSWEAQRYEDDRADLITVRARAARPTTEAPKPRLFFFHVCACGKTWLNTQRQGCSDGVVRCPDCNAKRWHLNHRRRAALYGVPYEHVADTEIFWRDKWRCQLCGRKTRGKYPALRSPSIDHVVPMSCGGPHQAHNLQTACLECNLAKGTTATGLEQLRLGF